MNYYTFVQSPVGPLLLTSDGTHLTGLFMEHGSRVGADWALDPDAPPFPGAARQLGEYFIGARTCFDLPLAPPGTLFQKRVWAELRRIPYGATISYGELARRIGNAGAARAVGLANGRNPVSIIVPCHRVVGANGKLVGYNGGLARKTTLLALEARETTKTV